ncbi:MAG TPA: FTR1 family protein [Gaiellales bacterium]
MAGACVLVALLVAAAAGSAGRAPALSDGQAFHLLLGQIPGDYAAADRTHDAAAAARLRTSVAGLRARAEELAAQPGGAALTAVAGDLARLDRLVATTSVRLQPWPLIATVGSLALRTRAAADGALHPAPVDARPYGEIGDALTAATGALASGRRADAGYELAFARALYEQGPGRRLRSFDSAVAGDAAGYWDRAQAHPTATALAAVHDELQRVRATLGEQSLSRVTIVSDAAIIVFREGLEAALIVAAITASFVGARRHLRRPVFIGAAAGLAASALTWVAAQSLVHALGDGGLRLQAITGLLAIGVLLLVTNWFFHRVYWSDWIGRFNRRRKSLELIDRTGFLSGQTAGFLLLGLTSVYREGFETVLFLQSLQTSAGTATTLLGTGIGLAGTLAVAAAMFAMQRKLPYKRMLIVTGALIGLVLAVMVGTTVHNLQGVGWVPADGAGFTVPFWWNTWFGIFPTWQGLAAQAGALMFVFGSYALARELQTKRPQRRARRRATAQLP